MNETDQKKEGGKTSNAAAQFQSAVSQVKTFGEQTMLPKVRGFFAKNKKLKIAGISVALVLVLAWGITSWSLDVGRRACPLVDAEFAKKHKIVRCEKIRDLKEVKQGRHTKKYSGFAQLTSPTMGQGICLVEVKTKGWFDWKIEDVDVDFKTVEFARDGRR